MQEIRVYFTKDLLNIDLEKIEQEIKKLEEIIETEKNAEKAAEINLHISILMFKQIIWLIFNKGFKNNKVYHLSAMGYTYLTKAQFKLLTKKRKITHLNIYFGYILLFSIAKQPNSEQIVIYDTPSNNYDMGNIVIPKDVENFLSARTKADNFVGDDILAYQAFIAIYGYNELLTNIERLILKADSLKKMSNKHPAYKAIEKNFYQSLSELKYFPFVDVDKYNISRFIKSEQKWAVGSFVQLSDYWIMNLIKNKHIFLPSREFKFPNHSIEEINYNFQEVFYSEFIDEEVTFNLDISETEFTRFIGHLHPFTICVGTSPFNRAFIVDLALKNMKIINEDFSIPENSIKKLLEKLKNEKIQSDLFQEIKDIAPKFGLVVKEIEMKKQIENLHLDQKQRLGALQYFKKSYFVNFDFRKAFFLLYKSIDHNNFYLPAETQLFSPLKTSFNEIKKMIRESFLINLSIYKILCNKSTNHTEKLQKLKLICNKIIKSVLTKKSRFLLQIQVYSDKGNHAIYGILEATGKNGIQVAICNGGYGVEYHTVVSEKNKKEKINPSKRVEFNWPNSDWTMYYEGEASRKDNDFAYYKIIMTNDMKDNYSYDAFLYYLTLICSGRYLIKTEKVCDYNCFMKNIYTPGSMEIKSDKWIQVPDLNQLEIHDSKKKFPKQVMSNCTIHNAIHAIEYAASDTEPLTFWFFKNMLEIGLDNVVTLSKELKSLPPQPKNSNWVSFFKGAINNSQITSLDLSKKNLNKNKLKYESWNALKNELSSSKIIRLIVSDSTPEERKKELKTILENNIKKYQFINNFGLKDKIARLFWENTAFKYNKTTKKINEAPVDEIIVGNIEAQKDIGLVLKK